MLATVFEELRKASETSMQMQQEMFRHWGQQWLSMTPNPAGTSSEFGKNLQKRWSELAVEGLRKQREALDSIYESGIQFVEQTTRASEARSAQELGQMFEEFWRKALDNLKDQSENQFREFQSWVERSFEMARTSNGQGAQTTEARSRS